MEKILGKNCKIGKLVKFIKEKGSFDDTQVYHREDEGKGERLTLLKIKEKWLVVSIDFDTGKTNN